MTVTYKGLDCIADQESDYYQELAAISQSGRNAWAYQEHYGYYVVYFGLVALFVMGVKNVMFKYDDYSYRNIPLGYKKSYFRPIWLSKIIAMSRILSYKRFPLIISRITGLPSSFGTLIVLSASTLYIFLFCFIPHPWFRECSGFGTPPLAIRAGLMCMGLTPFLYLMSGKTNFISWITGISYEKLNIFHQALGWGSFFLGMLHTIPFLTQPVKEGGYAYLNEQLRSDIIYANGFCALIILGFLCLLSTRFSRMLCYEIWFHCHWVLGLAYFALLTWHIYGLLSADKYMWATLGFWAFQMVYRALVKTTFKPNAYNFKSKTAQLTLLGNTGNIEVRIPIKGGSYELEWEPGQHIFIRFVHGRSTLDNHPFSIVSVPKRLNSSSHIKLIVKPQRGLTSKLHTLLAHENKTKELQTFIEGPYGGMNRDVLSFDQVVLLATGSGVSVTWPFVEHVAKNLYTPSNRVLNVRFVWVVKTIDCIEWLADEFVDAMNTIVEAHEDLSRFKFDIFVTNSEEVTPEVITKAQSSPSSLHTPSPSSSDLNKNEKSTMPYITRENFSDFLTIHMSAKPQITEYLQSTKLSSGKNCLIVSGSSSFQNDVGDGVSRLQKQVLGNSGIDEVYLHSENFGW